MNATETNYSKLNFDLESGKPWNLKISSWNIAGLKAWCKKQGYDFARHEDPDIICLQELKCSEEDLPKEFKTDGFHAFWYGKAGYSGVAILSKIEPIKVDHGIHVKEFDEECRLITAEYKDFYLVCVYVPNSGRGLKNLEKRMEWNKLFDAHLTELDKKKPVIIAGDMNVAHNEIDLKNPKTNKKNAGFTQEERDGFTDLLNLGFVDTYRDLYPDKVEYTFWTYMGGARAKNVGWRLDYFLVSERFKNKVVDNVMRTSILGSDHCPITLFLNL